MAQLPRRNPPHSSKAIAIAPSQSELEWFPDIKNPDSIIHQRINALNREAYLSQVFARADDFLIYMAFTGKGKKRRHHSVSPGLAQSGNVIRLSKQEGIEGANICKDLGLFDHDREPSWEAVVRSAESLQRQISTFQLEDEHWSACLRQYVRFFFTFAHSSVSFSISLLYRYSLIYSSGSTVSILKMTHNCQRATFGLKANRNIPSGAYIMETCSSMSLDLAPAPGPSIIESALRQLGPPGPRLILGPFRLVNHDCNPNAHVSFFYFPFILF